jgi:hypothetical protein
MKAFHGLLLLAVDVENRVQLGDLQKVGNFFVKVQELQLPALAFDHSVAADQFSKAGAIDVIDSGEIQYDFLMAAGELFPNEIAQEGASFSQSDSTVHVDDRDVSHLAAGCFKAHRKPFPFLSYSERSTSLAFCDRQAVQG